MHSVMNPEDAGDPRQQDTTATAADPEVVRAAVGDGSLSLRPESEMEEAREVPAPLARARSVMPPPDLYTRNGTGTALRGIVATGDGTFTGTVWQTRAHLPVRPISRHRFRVSSTETSGHAFGDVYTICQESALEFLDTTEFDRKEVQKTYLLGWVVVPLVLLLPGIILLIYMSVGDISRGWVGVVSILGPLVWLSLGYQGIADWLDKRVGNLAASTKQATGPMAYQQPETRAPMPVQQREQASGDYQNSLHSQDEQAQRRINGRGGKKLLPLIIAMLVGVLIIGGIGFGAFMVFVWEPSHRPVVVFPGDKNAPWSIEVDGTQVCSSLPAPTNEYSLKTCKLTLGTGPHVLVARGVDGMEVHRADIRIARGESSYLWAPEIPKGWCILLREVHYTAGPRLPPLPGIGTPTQAKVASGFRNLGRVDVWFEEPPTEVQSQDNEKTLNTVRLASCDPREDE